MVYDMLFRNTINASIIHYEHMPVNKTDVK